MRLTQSQAQALHEVLANIGESGPVELSGGQRGANPGAMSECITFRAKAIDYRISPKGHVETRRDWSPMQWNVDEGEPS